MKSQAPEIYSDEELAELREFFLVLYYEHVENYNVGGALWQREYGNVADHPIIALLRMLADYFAVPSPLTLSQKNEFLLRIGARVGKAIQNNDGDFFRALGIVLDARKTGRDLRDISRAELFLPTRRGRGTTALDLSRIFPLALLNLCARRLEWYYITGRQNTDERISRAEIISEIKSFGGTIAQSELSRWLKRTGFSKFVIEQPVTKKRPPADTRPRRKGTILVNNSEEDRIYRPDSESEKKAFPTPARGTVARKSGKRGNKSHSKRSE